MTNAELIGRCEKCGRGFLTLPAHMTDQYAPVGSKRGADGTWEICGGTIAMIRAAQESK